MIRDLSRHLKARSILSLGQRDDPRSGDQVSYINTHEVRITADEIQLQDNGGRPYRATMVDVTVDITTSGVDGLDTGTKAPETWYHLWVISRPRGFVKGLLSTSSSNPTLPPGYNRKAYVGAIYNNRDDYFVSYYQNDKLAWADKSCPLAMAAFPDTPTSVDLSASVPSTAISVILELSGLTTIGGHFGSSIYVGPTSNGPWHNQIMMIAGTSQGAGNIDHVQLVTQSEVILDSSQQMFAYVGSPNDRLELHVLGWRY